MCLQAFLGSDTCCWIYKDYVNTICHWLLSPVLLVDKLLINNTVSWPMCFLHTACDSLPGAGLLHLSRQCQSYVVYPTCMVTLLSVSNAVTAVCKQHELQSHAPLRHCYQCVHIHLIAG